MEIFIIRAFRTHQIDKMIGLDFVARKGNLAGTKTRTSFVQPVEAKRLENYLIENGWTVSPSLFLGGIWSARKKENDPSDSIPFNGEPVYGGDELGLEARG